MDPAGFAALVGAWMPIAGVFPPLQNYASAPAKLRFHTGRLALSALLGRERHFRKLNSSIAEWRAYRDRAGLLKEQPVPFQDLAKPQDQLVIIDSAWNSAALRAQILSAYRRGLTVATMVHDLIPLVRPDLCPDQAPLEFYDWLEDTLDFTTYYLANSEATRRDLQVFLEKRGASQSIKVVPLAQDRVLGPSIMIPKGPLLDRLDNELYSAAHAFAAVNNEVRRLSAMRYVLCVGSMEARKNNWRMLHAWDLLRRNLTIDQVPRLVFAGKSGWMNDDFENFLTSSGHLDGLVVRVEGPSDRDLDVLYSNCLFTVMPSLYEGWGLPVGESLSYGKTAVISQTTSLPEVGGDMVRYCDPQSIVSIMEACRDLLVTPELINELEAHCVTEAAQLARCGGRHTCSARAGRCSNG